MKVCIYGAGAIGGHIGGHLARSGVDVTLIARGPHLQAMQRNGIRIVSAEDDFTVPVRATDNPAELGSQDYVFITLKSHQVDGELAVMQPPCSAPKRRSFHRPRAFPGCILWAGRSPCGSPPAGTGPRWPAVVYDRAGTGHRLRLLDGGGGSGARRCASRRHARGLSHRPAER